MPHADTASLPSHIVSKADLWEHIYSQLDSLVAGQRNWVPNLANASSLIYHTLQASPHFGSGNGAVNWCGFYIDCALFPSPSISVVSSPVQMPSEKLLLGPFCGRPACQFINVSRQRSKGVCADSFTKQEVVLVRDVEAYPGHIACDAETRSEIVCPLILESDGRRVVLGVLDLDCLALAGFDEDDRVGLSKIAHLLATASDW